MTEQEKEYICDKICIYRKSAEEYLFASNTKDDMEWAENWLAKKCAKCIVGKDKDNG